MNFTNPKKLLVLICTLAPLAATSQVKAGDDWPNFRGPNLDGKSNEKGLLVSGDKKPKLMWDAKLGSAFSSFAVVGDRVYTCGTKNKKQALYCISAKDGKVLWDNAFEKGYRNEHGDGTRATPTVHDGSVYVLGAHGTLLCADAATGKTRWTHKFHNAPTWGYSASVLIESNMAITTAGRQEGALVALDLKTGKPVWKAGSDPAGYATPYPFTFKGKRYCVGFTGAGALVVEMATGKEVFSIPWETAWQVNAAAPIYDDGYLFISSGYRTGAGVYRLSEKDGKLAADQVWAGRVLLNKFQSCILEDGHLYTSDQRGLKCVEFITGREAWSIPRLKHGTVVLADGHLYFLTQDGELQVGKASPVGFEATLKEDILSGRCWTVSVLHDGRIFARSLERIVCYDMSAG